MLNANVYFNNIHSYPLKREWNTLVASYKEEIRYFDTTTINRHQSAIIGAELPSINSMTKGIVFEVLGNIYNATNQSFKFILNNDISTSLESAQQVNFQLANYAHFIKNKLDRANVSNFLPAIKQHIEDSIILGFGVSIVQEVEKEIKLLTVNPAHVEFDICNYSLQPTTFYIFTKSHRVQSRDLLNSLNLPYSKELESEFYDMKFIEVRKLENGKYQIRTYIRDSKCLQKNNLHDSDKHPLNDKTKYQFEYKLHSKKNEKEIHKDNFLFYYCPCDDQIVDYNPIIYTQFNIKTGESIGLGIGLESIAVIRELKNVHNTLRTVIKYESDKPLLIPAGILRERNDLITQHMPTSSSTTAPFIATREDLTSNELSIRPLERDLRSENLRYLYETTLKKLKDNYTLDASILTRGTVQMSQAEIALRDSKSKFQLDLYISDLKNSAENIIALFFYYYSGKYRTLKRDKDLFKIVETGVNIDLQSITDKEPEKPKVIDLAKDFLIQNYIEFIFISRTERETLLERLNDLNLITQLQTQIIANSQSLELDNDEIIKALDIMAVRLGVAHLSVNKQETPLPVDNAGLL